MLLQVAGCLSFLWLNNIQLYMHVCIPHSLFSSVNRHLGYFYVLAIVNNNAINMGVDISLWYSFHFLWYICKSEIAGSYDRLIFNSLKNPHIVSVMAESTYITFTSVQGFLFFHILSLVFIYLLDDNHSNGFEVISHCAFHLYFLND